MPEFETQRLFLRAARGGISARRRERAAQSELPIPEAPPPRFVRRRDGIYRRLLVCGDVVAAAVALEAVVGLAKHAPLRPLGVIAALAVLVLVNKLSGLYDRDDIVLHRSTLDEVPKLFQISGLFALVVWLLHRLVTHAFLHQTNILALWLVAFAGFVAARMAARAVAARITPPERCLVVGDGVLAQRVAVKMRDSRARASVAATIRIDEAGPGLTVRDERDFARIVGEYSIERVIVAQSGEGGGQTLPIVRMAKAAGMHVSLLPRLHEVVGSSVEIDQLDGLTVLGVRRFGLSRSSHMVKRTLDLLGATLGLVAVAPLFAVLALAVRIGGGPGPVFFRQTRVGKDGELFQMIKFRTMIAEAEALKASLVDRNETVGLFKIADDPRITRVGGLLRRTSLDELPQLLNVLKGEMSLVGPRPLVQEEDAMVHGLDRSRLHLQPGMTGHWQILGSARIPLDEMVAIDYLYVANWSLWSDIKILLRTVRHVLARGGM